jgi:hypothetical protein
MSWLLHCSAGLPTRLLERTISQERAAFSSSAVMRSAVRPARGAPNHVDQLQGGGVGKSKNPILRMFEVSFVLGKLYVIGDSEVHQRLFEQKFDSDIQFGCGT